MIRAENSDRQRIVAILVKSFDDNKSVNYIIRQDEKRMKRIKGLMEYAFDVCFNYGKVFLSDDKNGCALILLPDKKKASLKSIGLDARLALSVIGLFNVKKAMSRESRIKKLHPNDAIYYLWFIGTDPSEQNKGIGTALLKEIIDEARFNRKPIYLETSTLKNIPWYEQFGFKVYKKLDFGYDLYCMKKE